MIAILGGSFNPFHNGHKSMVNQALNELKVDKLVLLPCKKPPHKSSGDYASDNDRLAMLNEYAKTDERIIVDDYELKFEGFSFTAKTLPALKEKYNDELYFVLGGDSLENFKSWYEPEVIVRYANIAVCVRNDLDKLSVKAIIDDLKASIGGNYYLLDFTPVDISSSGLRTLIKNNESITSYVPECIDTYILEHKLYAEEKYYDIDELIAQMKATLKEKRFIHSLGVMQMALELAKTYNINEQSAKIAGILHDCAKNMSAEEIVSLCNQNNVPLDNDEMLNETTILNLIHSKAGSVIAKNIYNIKDEDIINSIYYHTVGRPNMSILEKIIYVSDFIEPNRTQNCNPSLKELRKLAFENLDKTVYYITKSTYDYLSSMDKPIHNSTIETLDYYKQFA